MLSGNSDLSPEEVVSGLCSMQAQDYKASLWAVGVRSRRGTTYSDVENCLKDGRIIRTWLNRGTIHLTHRENAKRLMEIMLPPLERTGRYRDGHLGITEEMFSRVKELFRDALQREGVLTRAAMYDLLEKNGISSTNPNMNFHILYRASWDGLICFGPQEGGEQTFVLVDHWIKDDVRGEADASLSLLISGYIRSHGPVTLQDMMWWTGLRASVVKKGLASLEGWFYKLSVEGKDYFYPRRGTIRKSQDQVVHLLPAFDEYILGYKDRALLFPNGNQAEVIRKNGIFIPTVISNGVVTGTWKARQDAGSVRITVKPISGGSIDSDGIREAVQQYGEFLESDVSLKMA